MSPKPTANKKAENVRSASGRSSAIHQKEAATRRFEEIQLSRINSLLRHVGNTREIVKALGGDPDKYTSQLAKRHADLSEKLRVPTSLVAQKLPPDISAVLNQLGDIFNWWSYVVAPNPTVVLADAPSSADTSGSIGAEIFTGDIAVGGDILNGGMEEQWWVNTWQTIVQFPETPSSFPSSASLSYRFDLPASLAFYRQDVITGSVHVYVTVAAVPDINNHLIDFANPASSNFAIVSSLPVGGVPPMIGGVAHVTGTIPLVPGGTPAIGILIGLIVSDAGGEVLILPGEDSFIRFLPPGATMPSDLGKIQYRRDPPYWVEAVSQMFAQAPS